MHTVQEADTKAARNRLSPQPAPQPGDPTLQIQQLSRHRPQGQTGDHEHGAPGGQAVPLHRQHIGQGAPRPQEQDDHSDGRHEGLPHPLADPPAEQQAAQAAG